MTVRVLTLAALSAAALAGCGDDADDGADRPQRPAQAAGGHHEHAMDGAKMPAGVRRLASTARDGMKVDVIAMRPEPFVVAEGTRQVRHTPRPQDNAHLMVALTDAASGEAIPYASVQMELVGPDGQPVLDRRLWPMVAEGVGLHYGENVRIPQRGRHRLNLTIGAPQVGRHSEMADRFDEPVALDLPINWVPPA